MIPPEKWKVARDIATELCKHFEGCKLTSYILKGETWATIGWGKAIPLSQHPKTISQQVADALLEQTLLAKEACLKREVPEKVLQQFSVEALGALLSFRYNMKDQVWLSPKCKTRTSLVSGDVKQFLEMHKQWIHGDGGELPGLKRRRRVERDLLQGKTLADIKKVNWYQSA